MFHWAFFRRREVSAPRFQRRPADGSSTAPDFVVFIFAVELALVVTITALAIGISMR